MKSYQKTEKAPTLTSGHNSRVSCSFTSSEVLSFFQEPTFMFYFVIIKKWINKSLFPRKFFFNWLQTYYKESHIRFRGIDWIFLGIFRSVPSVPFKSKTKALERHKLSLYGFLVLYSNDRPFTEWFLISASGKRAS